ncbi:MAG TPA: cupin domain-containing protein [Gaiellaceae bacterium]|nr:cupin domain-containing protein [Gaiellaceae bacterium]
MLVDIKEFRADEIRADPGLSVVVLSDQPRAQAYFVLEGGLALRLGEDERLLGRNTWAHIPAGVAHSVVAGAEPTRFLHVMVPSSEGSEVVIRRAGGAEGDRITNRPERKATVLVETDELTISEFDYGPGERGAPRHVHREHADAFLVLEGEFTFHLRDDSRALPAGTLVVFPPGVVHGFDNDSVGLTRAFNFHMPSFGFADYMRGRNPDFDQFDPPEDGGLDPATALVTVRLSL